MKTIFFNSRSLILCGEDRPGNEDPEAVIMVDNGEEALSEAVRTIDTNESISRLYILCQNIEDTYNRLRTRFTEIDAAGGLVRDSNGQYLLILRNGIWDLPKGKREKGEDVARTAVREVMEETGIRVGNIRYLSSQCWPYPNSLMLAFTAEYVSGELRPDGTELDSAGWFRMDALPELPPPGSIARRLIELFRRTGFRKEDA